jgi:hypothetical protein
MLKKHVVVLEEFAQVGTFVLAECWLVVWFPSLVVRHVALESRRSNLGLAILVSCE